MPSDAEGSVARVQSAKFAIAVLIGVLLFWSGVGRAQPGSASPSSTIYRLNQQSTYQTGCFPPCLCPVSQTVTVGGTLVLTPGPANGSFNTYSVTDVNWLVVSGNQELFFTGSGTYEVSQNDPRQQRLQLDLQQGNQGVQHFDSGLVATEAEFPDIAVTISIHGEKCFDTVFMVSASPVPSANIHPYHLLLGSSIQRGCFPPCACPLGLKQPLTGQFDLVDLPAIPKFQEFAIVNISWVASKATTPVSVSGFGFYRIGRAGAVKHELLLELTVGDQAPTQFHSGLLPGSAGFPRINGQVSINGKRCADTVITINASH